MTRFKSLFAAAVASAIVAVAPAASAQTFHFVGAGSSAQFTMAAVATDEAACIMTGQPGVLSDYFRARINHALAERMDDTTRKRTAAFLNSCLNLLEEEFANLGGEREIDPRFIESVLVKIG